MANETQAEYHAILAWINYLGYAIYIIRLLKGEVSSKVERGVLICILIMVLYACVSSFFQHIPLFLKVKYVTSNFGFILYLTSLNRISIPENSMFKWLRKILYLEIALGLLQPFSNFFNFKAALEGDGVMTTFINGTFIRNNVFIEFLSPLAILLIFEEYTRKGRFTKWCTIISFIVVYLTFSTGVRTALIAIAPIVLISLYHILSTRFHSKLGRISFIVLFLLGLYASINILGNIASNIGITYTKNATSSIERQTVLASIANDKDFASEQTTLMLSYDVLRYYPKNPIIGPGLLFKGNGYAGYISMKAGNVTDATLAIYLCETGIIGTFLFICLYLIVLRQGTKCSKLIFLYLLIVTIADPGLFFVGNVILLFLSMKCGKTSY